MPWRPSGPTAPTRPVVPPVPRGPAGAGGPLGSGATDDALLPLWPGGAGWALGSPLAPGDRRLVALTVRSLVDQSQGPGLLVTALNRPVRRRDRRLRHARGRECGCDDPHDHA